MSIRGVVMRVSIVMRFSVLLFLFSAALARAEVLEIREGYVRELPPGQSTSAAYMNIVNTSDRPVALVAALSDVSQTAEIHQHVHVGSVMRMDQVRRLVIPARDHVQFAPGGYHLMLINLKRSLRAGDNVNLTLLDEEGKKYSASVPVVKMIGGGS